MKTILSFLTIFCLAFSLQAQSGAADLGEVGDLMYVAFADQDYEALEVLIPDSLATITRLKAEDREISTGIVGWEMESYGNRIREQYEEALREGKRHYKNLYKFEFSGANYRNYVEGPYTCAYVHIEMNVKGDHYRIQANAIKLNGRWYLKNALKFRYMGEEEEDGGLIEK